VTERHETAGLNLLLGGIGKRRDLRLKGGVSSLEPVFLLAVVFFLLLQLVDSLASRGKLSAISLGTLALPSSWP
jgi:hypothetical protein